MNLPEGSLEVQVVEEGIRTDDSISRISHKTKKSQSGSSTISAIRIKTAQEKAELEIKQKKLKEKQTLERQKSELKLMEEELELQTAMDIVSAKSKVTEEIIERSSQPDSPNPNAIHISPKLKDVDTATRPPVTEPTSRTQPIDYDSTIPAATALIQNIKRPPVDLKKFGGDPLEYKKFLRQFESKVVLYTSTDDERMNYLEQFTYGQPNKIVSGFSFLNAKVGYKAALKELELRYGDPNTIANAYCGRALSWQPIKTEFPKALDDFGIFLTECYNAIKHIDSLKILEYPDNLRKLLKKLPYYLQDRFRSLAQSNKDKNQPVHFLLLVTFVKSEAKKLMDPVFRKDAMADKKTPDIMNNQKPRPRGAYAVNVTNINRSSDSTNSLSTHRNGHYQTSHTPSSNQEKWIHCLRTHSVGNCKEFETLPHHEKLNILRRNGRCFGCLEKGHMRNQCDNRIQCSHCEFRHPSVLHITGRSDNFIHSSDETSTKALANTTTSHRSVMRVCEPECSMAILPVKVRALNGLQSIETYAFIDTGSSVTFITEHLMNQLGIEGKRTRISLDSMTDTVSITSFIVENLEVLDYRMNNSVIIPRCYSKNRIPVECHHIPRRHDIEKWPHLKNIGIPEPDCRIGLMIGNNIPDALTPIEIATCPRGSPHASRTSIGWILWNVLRDSTNRKNNPATVNRAEVNIIHEYERLNELDSLVRRSIDLEFPERSVDDKNEHSVLDERFFEHVNNSVGLVSGHYEIGLPFKNQNIKLPDNKSMTLSRLKGIERKFIRNPEFKKDYVEFMNTMLSKGYAEEVPLEEIDNEHNRKWFIPHHGVYHKQKKKLRIVFDCSAKYDGVSLNDILLSGPDLANNLVGVLMRFRLGKIGLISDIEAMFHQIKIPVEDRDSLRFLWWPDGNLESAVTQYRMTSHLFGAISSPSIANFALQRTVKDFSDKFDKDVLDTVLNYFYVDDCLRSVDTEEEASSLVKNLVEICRLGGFHLHTWISNSPTVMQSIPETERASCNVVTMGNNESIIERALGVSWNLASDCFTFKINVGNQPYTRRGLLSIISSIFDPLGFASPALLYPKLLLQELCQKGIPWDQSLGEVEHCTWFRWLTDLPKLESIHIPRCVKPSLFKDVISIQLHNFADASNLGYGIACYLRLVDSKGSISCSLILEKSRVTPLKKSQSQDSNLQQLLLQ